MKKIPLTQGKFAVVNNVDYEFLMQWKWHFHKSGGYAVRNSHKSDGFSKHTMIYMHRIVLIRKLGHSNFEQTDHEDGDALNNCRFNLRPSSRSQNGGNSKSRIGLSKFKGVHWHKRDQKWQASIMCNRVRKYLGLFTDEIEAAKAYNKAALKYFGKFACLNLI